MSGARILLNSSEQTLYQITLNIIGLTLGSLAGLAGHIMCDSIGLGLASESVSFRITNIIVVKQP